MNWPSRGAVSTRGAGFTLVEVAVVIVLVGVLAGVAVVFIKPGSVAATPRGYADEIAALADAVRQRAVASRTVQRVVVDAAGVTHRQAQRTGMANPAEIDDPDDPNDDPEFVAWLPAPADVVIASVDETVTHIRPNQDVPAPGDGIPAEIDFFPDGTAEATTIFVEDVRSDNRARVAIYRATGSAYVYYEW